MSVFFRRVLLVAALLLAWASASTLISLWLPQDGGQACSSDSAADRSPQWSAVRGEHLQREPACVACSASRKVDVHHVLPFHERPDLELDRANLITLCPRCHFVFGHLCDWRSWNDGVRRDAEWFRGKRDARPGKSGVP